MSSSQHVRSTEIASKVIKMEDVLVTEPVFAKIASYLNLYDHTQIFILINKEINKQYQKPIMYQTLKEACCMVLDSSNNLFEHVYAEARKWQKINTWPAILNFGKMVYLKQQ